MYMKASEPAITKQTCRHNYCKYFCLKNAGDIREQDKERLKFSKKVSASEELAISDPSVEILKV